MKVVKKEILPVPPPPVEYTITLNQHEVETLYMVLGSIGGSDGAHGYRNAVNTMHEALAPHVRGTGAVSCSGGQIKENY